MSQKIKGSVRFEGLALIRVDNHGSACHNDSTRAHKGFMKVYMIVVFVLDKFRLT